MEYNRDSHGLYLVHPCILLFPAHFSSLVASCLLPVHAIVRLMYKSLRFYWKLPYSEFLQSRQASPVLPGAALDIAPAFQLLGRLLQYIQEFQNPIFAL